MNSLLIIGGSGFFGKSILDAFVRGLLKPWHISKVIVIARSARTLLVLNPELITSNVQLIDLDITTADVLPFADYVIHAASSTDARNYQKSPENEKMNITQGINNYCRLAEKFHRKSKIIFTSSGAIYGQQPHEIRQIQEKYIQNDIGDLEPQKIHYAQAKKDAEVIIQELAKKGLNVSIARCFAFVGQHLPRDQHFAIGNFLSDGLSGKSICVKASHQVYRSYMYADDLVEWLMTIAHNANTECPIFNVGSDEETSLINLAKIVSIRFGLNFVAAEITSTHVDRYIPSIQKAKTLLNLKLNYNLQQAVDKTISLI